MNQRAQANLAAIERAELEKRWLDDNREAIASINSFIERHGLLSSKLRYRPA